MSFRLLDEEETTSSKDEKLTPIKLVGGREDDRVGDDEVEGDAKKDKNWRVRLKEQLTGNKKRIRLVGVALLLICVLCISAVALSFVGSSRSDDLIVSPDEWCSECFRGDPDECGFVPVAYYPFSQNQTVRRNNQPQYNGNPG